jgi:hypothetical protein
VARILVGRGPPRIFSFLGIAAGAGLEWLFAPEKKDGLVGALSAGHPCVTFGANLTWSRA